MISKRTLIASAILSLTFSSVGVAQSNTSHQSAPPVSEEYTPSVGQVGKDVVWVPTSQTLVDRMLNMAKLTANDHLVDLGSGDGRTVITAAKRGATARGIEYNPDLVELSKRTAKMEGVADTAVFEQADIFESDFSNATVVTLFLLPSLNIKLRPTLLNMKPGTRVVSNSFAMEDWEPDETAEVQDNCTNYCNAYKWIVPAKVSGTWKIGDKELEIVQNFQMLDGTLRNNDTAKPISNARMDGANITFSVGNEQYTGTVNNDTMQGTINGKTNWDANRLSMQ